MIRTSLLGFIAVALTAGLCLAAQAAAAHVVTIPANGEYVAFVITAHEGDKVHVSYSTTGYVVFEVLTPVTNSSWMLRAGSSWDGVYTFPTDGTFHFKFKNPASDAPVIVDYDISEYESSLDWGTITVIAVGVVVVFLALIAVVLLRRRP